MTKKFGVKFEQDIIKIMEGTEEGLAATGFVVAGSRQEAEKIGKNLEYRTLRKEFLAMDLKELDSDRAEELERRIWGCYAKYDGSVYVPGEIIKRQKEKKTLQ